MQIYGVFLKLYAFFLSFFYSYMLFFVIEKQKHRLDDAFMMWS